MSPEQQCSDEERMGRYYQCSNEAFAELYRRYYPRLVAFYTHCGLERDAEDLAQDVMLHIARTKYRINNRFDPSKGKFSTWLWRIAGNNLAESKRGPRGRMASSATDPAVLDGRPSREDDPAVLAERADASAFNLRCIRNLPEQQSELVFLFYIEDLTYAQVAEILDVDEETVRRELHKARQMLRQQLMNHRQ